MVFPILGSGSQAVSYDIDNSIRLDGTDARLVGQNSSGDPFNSAGNRRTWTVSFWIKQGKLSHIAQHLFDAGTGTTWGGLYISTDQKLHFYAENSSSAVMHLKTSALFRDYSAWWHFVVAVDTTQATASNRVKIYVNGVRINQFATETYPSQNLEMAYNNNVEHDLACYDSGAGASNFYSGYMAEFFFIDGTQYAATDFGEFDISGIWKPKDAKDDLTFGSNGAYLEFKQSGSNADANGYGADTSGNGNHWGHAGHTAGATMTDTPTNNFCTWNPDFNGNELEPSYLMGNLYLEHANDPSTSAGTFIMYGGKWYYECLLKAGAQMLVGYTCADYVPMSAAVNNVISGYYGYGTYYSRDGAHNLGSGVGALSAGDVAGLAVDVDNKSMKIYKNGSIQATITGISVASPSIPVVYMDNNNPPADVVANFGADGTFTGQKTAGNNSDANGWGNFLYTVPTGYYAICTKNLAEFGGR